MLAPALVTTGASLRIRNLVAWALRPVGLKGRVTMKLHRLLKSLLKTAVYIMDQTSEQVERASDRASHIADEAKSVIYPEEDHTLRNILSFAAGVGLGVGAGILLAPASGAEMRSSISEKVQDIGDKVRERFSPDRVSRATGTDAT